MERNQGWKNLWSKARSDDKFSRLIHLSSSKSCVFVLQCWRAAVVLCSGKMSRGEDVHVLLESSSRLIRSYQVLLFVAREADSQQERNHERQVIQGTHKDLCGAQVKLVSQ